MNQKLIKDGVLIISKSDNMKAKKKKLYTVNIDLVWSQDYCVKANSAAEAKRIAFKKFLKTAPRKDFRIDAEKIGI